MKRGFAIALVYFGLLLVPVGIGAIVVPPIVNGANDLAQNAPEYARRRDEVRRTTTRRCATSTRTTTSREDRGGGRQAALQDRRRRRRAPRRGLRDRQLGLRAGHDPDPHRLHARQRAQLDRLRAALRARRTAPTRIERVLDRRRAGPSATTSPAPSPRPRSPRITAYIVLKILGVPFAAPLALIIFFLDLIPLVGATIGAVIVGVFTLFQDFPTATIVWTIYSILYQQVENNLHPAADPEARGGHQPVPGDRVGAVRQRAARGDRRAGGRAGRRVDPDRRARVPGLPRDQPRPEPEDEPPPPAAGAPDPAPA